jgi:hypothetical protein
VTQSALDGVTALTVFLSRRWREFDAALQTIGPDWIYIPSS